MFAFKLRTEIAMRVWLIVIFLLNVLVPNGASAAVVSPSSNEQTESAYAPNATNQPGSKGSIFRSSGPFRAALQKDITPTAFPTDTETSTPEPSATPSPQTEITPTITLDSKPTATVRPTSSANETPIPTQTSNISTETPGLSIAFSASPKQATAGGQVTFTVKIENNGESPSTGLRFSNILPAGFNYVPGNNKDFKFNAQTRELIWNAENESSLQPRENVTLEYTVEISESVADVQIIDTARVSAIGLLQPMVVETEIIQSSAGTSLTVLDSQGGRAIGLNGQIELNLSEKTLGAPGIISIRDLRAEASFINDGEPWLLFELGLRTPQDEQLTSSDVPSDAPARERLEKDRILPLKQIEAKFANPVELSVSLDGLVDLATLGADQAPYLVTLDEASDTWVRVPLKTIDQDANKITAELTHFSVWGVGIGSTTPQNGANILLYDNAYPNLFTGRVSYSIPIWTPLGRNGMAPNLALSYSSKTADGLLGDIQAPWVGMGWNVDTVEIARKITNGGCNPCGSGSYGYENKFLLLFNGVGYELIPNGVTPGRYHTKDESFLYVQLHNPALGNNSPATTNNSKEWWEVVQKDGTRWRLGFTTGTEQLAAMKGYPGKASGTWAALGYAGTAKDVVAARWRAEQVTDTYGNRMTFTYVEENRLVAGTSANYNRASYLDTITYTSHTSGTPTAGYSVVFMRESRAGSDVPATPTDWDNWDTERLDRIDVKYGANVVRAYDLGYTTNSYTDDTKSWQTTVLSSVAVSGGGVSAPTITLTYSDKDNRANCGAGCQEWAYPRLASVASGWGSTVAYTYANDGRPNTSWYNWRVTTLDVTDGVNASPMKTLLAYSTPCYKDPTAGWCNAGNIGELVGYGQTTATIKDFNGTTTLGISVHSFHTDEQKAGRESQVQNQNASGTTLSQTSTTYTVVTAGLPTNGYFTYASAVEQYLRSTSLTRISRTEYEFSATTGNLTFAKEYDGTPTLYRETDYEYVTNPSPSVWILNTLFRKTLKDAVGVTLSKQEFGYNGNLPGVGLPTTNKPDLSRIVNGAQTIDTKFVFDSYGNVTETRAYKNYGSTASQPAGTYLSYTNIYDTALKTHATSVDTPLIPATTIAYDFGLGAPTTVTDPNGNTTTTAYDGLGRVTSVTYPGFGSPNIKYTYPTIPISAPFAVKVEVWDQPASLYRSSWQVMDGLGRVMQTQSPFETAGVLVITDTSYNAQGLSLYQGLPRNYTGSGGSYFAPTWASVPHTTSVYDALGRTTSVAYPDSSSESFSYSGLRTTAIDRNTHQKVQEVDSFGRPVKAEEYTGSGTYTLYATTTYEYDPRNLLKKVIDTAGNQTIIGYNGFGRKDAMTDPDMGSWSYGYSVLGNLTTQTDARGCVTTVTYDDLNRPTGKTYAGPGACNPTPDVTYTYDSTAGGNEGLGRRTGMTDGSGSTTYVYNVLGQMTNQTRNIESTNYSVSAAFDALNRPLTQTLPSGEVLNYSYNAMGALSSLSGTNTYTSQIHYNSAGQVTDQLLGNNLRQQSCYDTNTLRLTGLRIYSGTLQACGTNPASPRLNLSYSYQPNGNISQLVDTTRNETHTYTYDELDRLKSVSGPTVESFSYNTIGNTTNTITNPPVSNLTAADAGSFNSTCSMTTGGGAKCWGSDGNGKLGNGGDPSSLTPVSVSGLDSGVAAIAVGGHHSCALLTTGGVKCWGYNIYGQVGDGTTPSDRNTPVDVIGLTSGVAAISTGSYHSCALLTTGGVKCWGYNGYGQLGNGSTTDSSTPVDVTGLTSGVVAITAGGYHTCALLAGGTVKCWGYNFAGQLGDNSTTQRTTPVSVSGLSNVSKISAGGYHSCALLTSGGMKCWGYDNYGQVGDNEVLSNRLIPVDVMGLTSGVTFISAGDTNTCAIITGGAVKCWGWNAYGEIGDGTTTQRNTPVNVSGLTSGVNKISAGIDHTCASLTGGGVKCWGRNDSGDLGNGTIGHASTPVTVLTPSSSSYSDPAHKHAVTSLSTGETFTYDANGNMTTRVEGGLTYNQVFDAENRLISVTVSGQTTQFVYDGNGAMVKKIKPDGSRTVYVGGIYEVDKSSGGAVTRTVTYYPAGGAMRINSTLYYILKDHLGSASVVTDTSGVTVGETRYYSYGGERLTTGTIYTDKLFTGQREMADLGIYHYGARFYSPMLGRFLSADTIVPNPYNPQDFNRFSYVRNNPLRYTDPTGHWVDEGCGYSACNDTTSSGVQVISGTRTGNSNRQSNGGLVYSAPTPSDLPSDDDIVINLDIDNIPGTADFYSDLATSLDVSVLGLDLSLEALAAAGFIIGYWYGAAWSGGTPVTGLPGGFIGWSIVQMSVQPIITAGNWVALAATVSGTIADDMAGNSEIGLSIRSSASGTTVDMDMQLSSSVQEAWTITYLSFQGEAQLTETSLLLQAAAVANDFGILPPTPWGTLDLSQELTWP